MKNFKFIYLFSLGIVLLSSYVNSSPKAKTLKTNVTQEFTLTDTTTEDLSLEEVLNEVESKFLKLTYIDPEKGTSLNYNLFIPKNYNKNQSYPMVTFIHDDSITGKNSTDALIQGYGGVIWATNAEQQKHESFVLVPLFSSSTIAGGTGQSGSAVDESQISAFLGLLKLIQTEYSIDNDRFYITGQSMGCMTAFYLNSHYPDLFTATIYVAGQWDITQLSPLEKQKFFYIVGGGDERASIGQKNLINSFNKAKINYSEAIWNATWSTQEKNEAAKKVISENTNANFITWTTGSVLINSNKNMEHMASFDYAYTIPVVRDWLFDQKK